MAIRRSPASLSFCQCKSIAPSSTISPGPSDETVYKVARFKAFRELCLAASRKESCGSGYSLRYDQLNAMLLNEFLKEHRTVQELKSNAAKQEATIARQQKQIEVLSAGLQKVNAQIELSKRAPQTGLNNH